MKRRLLAGLLTLCMLFSLLPTAVFAAGLTYDKKDQAIEATGVTANKTVSGPDQDGNYTVTLSVEGNTTTDTQVKNLPADIVLVVDTSTSMAETISGTTKICGGTIEETWGLFGRSYQCNSCGASYSRNEAERLGYICNREIRQNRLDVAKEAAKQFVSGLLDASDQIRVGLYDFSGSNRTDVALTSNETTLLTEIEGLRMPGWGDGTDYGLGLSGAESILEDSASDRQKFVVFLSDGEPQSGQTGTTVANRLKNNGVTIMTVGIDFSNKRYLEGISSQDSEGNYYCYQASSDGSSGDALSVVLSKIQEEIENSIYSGTDAIMTDVVNTDDFELISSDSNLQANGNVLTWNIGIIGSGEQSVSFKVKPLEGKYGTLHTNKEVSLTFDSSMQEQEVTFTTGAIGDPTIEIEQSAFDVTYNRGANGHLEGEDSNGNVVHKDCLIGSDTPAAPAVTPDEGWYFTGWSPEISEKVTAEAVYTAQYAQKTEITIKATDISKVYDGTTQTSDAFTTTLPDGYTVTGVTVSGSGKDVKDGGYPLTVDASNIQIKDAQGKDVTDHYTVATVPGTLTITKRPITFTSGSGTKEYDGSPLTNGQVTVTNGSFATGEGADVTYTVTGSQTLVGDSENTFTVNWTETTKESNYEVTLVKGTLKVTDRTVQYEIQLKPKDVKATYDGTAHGADGFQQLEYEFNGQTFTVTGVTAVVDGTAIDAGTYDILVNGEAKVLDAQNNDVTDQFIVTENKGTLTVEKRLVTLTSERATKVYDGTPLTNPNFTVGGLGFVEGEVTNIRTTGSLVQVGNTDNTIAYDTSAAFKADNYTIQENLGQLVVTAPTAKYQIELQINSGSKTYDGQPITVEGFKQLTFAWENGAQYTVSGLTAQRTETNAGEYQVTASGDYTVTDGYGNDVTALFDVTVKTGTLNIAKRSVTLTSATDTKVYDGTPLTNDEVTVSGEGFVEGQGADYTVTGTRTLPGNAANYFTYELWDNTLASNYAITKQEGNLSVTNRPDNDKLQIQLKAKSMITTYDGTEKTVEGFETTSFVVNGATFTVEGITAKASGTDADSYTTIISNQAVVKDADGNVVTDQFAVTVTSGTLTINPRQVTLTSESGEKMYDGTALTKPEVTVDGVGFVDGEVRDIKATGSVTLPGSGVTNTISFIKGENYKNQNYVITLNEGTLKITDRPETDKYEITVVANSATAKYDGSAKTVEGFQTLRFTASNGLEYTVEGLSASATATDAGTYPVKVTGEAVVKDAQGNDVTGQFIVKTQDGELTIEKRNVTLTSATDSKEYDGSPLTNNTVTVSGDDFAEGEGATYKVTGSQTIVGSSANTFDYTLNEGTNANNYNITKTEGTLTVTNRDAKYEITVVANSATFKYDGSEKNVSGIMTDTFTVNGHTYKVSGLTASASGTNAGKYTANVEGTAVVKDEQNNDVSSQFSVMTQAGTLTIEKRNVTLTSATDSKEYDGTALTNDQVTVGGDGFATGEGATYAVTGSQTLVGNSANYFTYTLNENTNEDNYNITTQYGQLTVTNRDTKYQINVVANSGTFKYDGTPKTVEGFQTLEFTMDNNVKYTVDGLSASVIQTDAGKYTVNVEGTAVVKDASGKDVSDQFSVTVTPGTLTINPRQVTLTSGSATKMYDGTPLTYQKVDVTGDGFVDGQGATYTVTGSQTLVGESDNAFTYALNEGTKEGNYEITTAFGTLEITSRPETNKYEITVEANSGTFKYDGTAKTVDGFQTLEFTMNNGVKYTVEGLSASATATDAGTYPVVVTGEAVVKDANDNVVTDQFIVKTVNGNLTIEKRNVTMTSATASKQYDGNPLTNSNVTVDGDGFVEGQGATYNVTGSQTIVGSSANAFTYTLNEGTNADNYNITTQYGQLTVTNREAKYEITVVANSATFKYDGSEKNVSGIMTDTFTVNGHTYKVSGLTASASGTNAGKYTANVEGTAVVKDEQDNDVTGQFSVKTQAGTLNIEKRNVTLTSGSAVKQYDGTPLTNDKMEIGGDNFAAGEGAIYTVTGSQTLVGNSANYFTYNLNENTKADNYNITPQYGQLTVTNRDTKYQINVVANSGTYLYDGTPKTVEGFQTLEFTMDNGVKYTVEGLSASVTRTDAGKYTVNVEGTAVVKDASGKDVSDQFSVTVTPGTLTINPRQVTLTSGSATKMYDGTPLTHQKVDVTGDGFAEGEGAIYDVTGSQTLVGKSENAFTHTLNEGTKAGNYEITTVFGTLEITSRPETDKYEITVVANSNTFKYDGTAKTVDGFQTLEFTMKNGVKYTVEGLSASATATDAGTYPVKVTGEAVVKDAQGNDVTGQFIVKTQDGELTIEKRNVTLTSATASKEYDGSPLTNSNVTVAGDGFVEGEGATYKVTGSQTIVGSSANTFDYTLNEGTNANNYNITKTEGTLMVTNRDAKYEITVVANSATAKYDGSEKNVSGIMTDTFEVNGHTYKVSEVSASASGTDAGTYTANVEGTAVVKDANGNIVTDQFSVMTQAGTLTIQKRDVTMTSATDSKEYDGTALTNGEVTVTGDGFATGEGATYTVTGSQTLVGTSENYFTYTLNENTNKDNYNITTNNGQLTVTNRGAKYEITVVANSNTFKYDGTAKTVDGFQTLEFTMANGVKYTVEGLSASVTATDAGEYTVNVTGTAIVLDADKNDVSDEFAVTPVAGSLVIEKRDVILLSASDSKMYDGIALTNDQITVGGDGFVNGEGATYTVTGSQTLVGESDNAFTYTLNEGTKEGNYNIEKVYGKLVVSSRSDTDQEYEITVEANSGTFKYDGTEKSVNGFKTLEFTMANGVKYTVEGLSASVSATDAGTYPVEVTGTAVVKDAQNNDVTSQFIVKTVNGSLTIEKRNVTLTSATDSKQYDGTALTNDQVTVTGDGFIAGEGATYTVTGSQTIVGSSTNAFTYTLNEGTKAENYNITKSEGTLTVTNRDAKYEITVVANSKTEMYDGTEKMVEGFETLSFTMENGTAYTVSGLTASASGTDAGDYTANVVGTAVVKDAQDNDVTNQFAVNTKDGLLTIQKRNVTMTSGSASKEYDGTALTNGEVTVTGDGFIAGEGATYTVTGSQTLVGASANYFTYTLNENTKADNYNITTQNGQLTVTTRDAKYQISVESNSGSFLYDGTAKTVEGFKTLEFTMDNGVKYTVDGLSASVTQTNAGTYKIVISGTAIVRDANGNDVSNEFAVTMVPGEMTITPRQVTLTSESGEKVYDGTALTKPEVTVTGDGFVDGEVSDIKATGSITLVGTTPNTIAFAQGPNFKAENYNITKNEGTLKVTELTGVVVTITEPSATVRYDGKEHVLTGYDVSINNPLYTEEDFVFTGDATVRGSAVGVYPMELKASDFTNTNSNFAQVTFVIVDGALTIERRSNTDYYYITATAKNGGSITPDGVRAVAEGASVTYKMTPNEGYRVSDVLVDGVSIGAVNSYTFENVQADHTIVVSFLELPTDPDESGVSDWLNTDDHILYMVGYPDKTFGPDRNITRAEVAQLFYALLRDQDVAITTTFSDVNPDAWYATAVNTMASLGMVTGYPDGTFHPDAPITRAEFVAVALAFAYEPENASCVFSDVSTSSWFYTYVAQATTYGWIGGYPDGSFRPNNPITRAEVSVIVNNMLGRNADREYVDKHVDKLTTFPDVRPSYWAYYSIMETTNAHDYTKHNGLETWK